MIKEVTSHKHLGVYLQHDAKWSEQVGHMIQKANKKVTIIKRYSRVFHRSTLLTMYKSYVRPHLEYASQLLVSMITSESDDLEKIQRAAIRAITGAKKCGTTALKIFMNYHNFFQDTPGERHFFNRPSNWALGYQW